jgi:hypothetical protein
MTNDQTLIALRIVVGFSVAAAILMIGVGLTTGYWDIKPILPIFVIFFALYAKGKLEAGGIDDDR